jgi:hypothetical protein
MASFRSGLFISLSVLFTIIVENNSIAQNCTGINSAFKPGEELTYTVSYNWFILRTEVGEIKIKIDSTNYQGKPAYLVFGTGTTYISWDRFFQVRDIYQSYIDPFNLKPFCFKRDIQEGDYKHLDAYDFNFNDNRAISQYKVNENPLRTDTISITKCTFDIISALLYTRNLDFIVRTEGDIIPITIILDQELYSICFRYMGIERLKVKNIGEFECIKLSVALIEGSMFREGESMTVWVTNDKNRLPVYIESPIIVGAVNVRLIDLHGNKHPFTSLIHKSHVSL